MAPPSAAIVAKGFPHHRLDLTAFQINCIRIAFRVMLSETTYRRNRMSLVFSRLAIDLVIEAAK